MKKRNWLFLILLAVFALDHYIHMPDSHSAALNRALEAHASDKLKNYPYKFHVIKMEGDAAMLSTPRNFDVPAFRALAVLYPKINVKDANDPEFIAAEHLLGEVQAEARLIVLAQPGVKEVRWALDRDWLVAHDIEVPDK